MSRSDPACQVEEFVGKEAKMAQEHNITSKNHLKKEESDGISQDESAKRKPTILGYLQQHTFNGLWIVSHKEASLPRKALWLVFGLALTALYAFFSYSAIMRYLSYPVTSNIEYLHVESLEFPDITICASNSLRKSYYEEKIKDGSLPAFRSPAEFLHQQVRLGRFQLNFTEYNENITDGAIFGFGMDGRDSGPLLKLFYDSITNEVLQQHLEEGSNQIKDLLVTEDWYGICYRYGDPDKSNLIGCETKSFIHPRMNRLCHTVTFTFDNQRLTTNQSLGVADEVLFMLYSDPNELLHIGQDDELFIEFHSPEAYPMQFLPIYPNRTYNYRLERTDIHNLPLPHGATDCIDTDAPSYRNPLKHFAAYDREKCRIECTGAALVRECGCTLVGFPKENGSAVCATNKCELRATYTAECEQCVPACRTHRYHVTYHQVEDARLLGRTELFVKPAVYAFTRLGQSAAFTREALFGELGGQLGLFLGLSVMTLYEFCDSLLGVCTMVVAACRGRKIA